MRRVRDLFSAAAQTVRDMRAAAVHREPIDFGSAQAAPPGPQVMTAEITAINATTFTCKWHDADGNVTGDAFTVRIFSLPLVGGVAGAQDPQDCDPQRVVGDLLRIEYRSQYVGGGSYVTDWWAVQEFTLFDCEVECA